MRTDFITAALALGSSAAAHVLPRSSASRCAAQDPSARHIKDTEALIKYEQARHHMGRLALAPISVDTYFHVISASESSYINEAQIDEQLAVMNEAFSPSSVSFTLLDTSFTVNGNWAAGNDELDMKRSLRRGGTYSTLNVYFVDAPKLDGYSALGYCHFPESGVAPNSTIFTRDGCVVQATTVPGGGAAPYDLGGTAVHEIGHWFDVYHTFQGGCSAQGDFVEDTPPQGRPTSGCPARSDTCPSQPGDDDIHNFMDYSDDACYEYFSPGQAERMHSAWDQLRNI